MSVWTGLDTLPIKEGDIVVLGHVRDYLMYFLSHNKKIRSDFEKNNPHKVGNNFEACFSQNPKNKKLEDILDE